MAGRKSTIQTNLTLSKPIGAVIKLHKVGINFFGKCPFCNDPAASFCIPDHQEWWVCFNCSKRGDLAAFKSLCSVGVSDKQISIDVKQGEIF